MVPFYVAGKAVGTIWAIMHSDRRGFDAEDERVLTALVRQTDLDAIVEEAMARDGEDRRLGLPRTTLVYKMRKLGIEARRSHRSRFIHPAGDGLATERVDAVGSF